jgi:hypothetical protein
VVEGTDDLRVGQQRRGLLGDRTLGDLQDMGAALVEAQGDDAVDDDLAGQLCRQTGEGVGVAAVGDGDDDQVAGACDVGVAPAAASRTARPRPWGPVPPRTPTVSPLTSGSSRARAAAGGVLMRSS